MSQVFTRTTNVEDAAGVLTPTVTTISGAAFARRGKPGTYRALGLIPSAAPMLFFTPTTYLLRAFTTEFVMPGDVTTWAGEDYTVLDVDPFAPDGYVIHAYIVITK